MDKYLLWTIYMMSIYNCYILFEKNNIFSSNIMDIKCNNSVKSNNPKQNNPKQNIVILYGYSYIFMIIYLLFFSFIFMKVPVLSNEFTFSIIKKLNINMFKILPYLLMCNLIVYIGSSFNKKSYEIVNKYPIRTFYVNVALSTMIIMLTIK